MEKSLYVHIPFCVQKCLYCDFNSYTNINFQDEYIDALIKELDLIKEINFKTIFIGGGTPTILSIPNFERLLEKVSKYKAIEFTVEANPGTLNQEKLELMKLNGVNRLSIGLQAWQDRLLKKLGRIHNLGDFIESYNNARKCGYNNINIDLMFGLPDQSMEDWKETVGNVLALKPEHISSYGLIIEEGTPFFNMHEKGTLVTPGEDIENDMYHYAINEFKNAGLHQYEISNFSLDGYECIHNLTYWRDEEYIGVGAGAHSYIQNKRFFNLSGVRDYIRGINSGSPIEEETSLSKEDEMSEFMFLGLRLMKGIDINDFKLRFGMDIDDIYSREILESITEGLLIRDGVMLKLTPKGVDFSNQVFVKFIK